MVHVLCALLNMMLLGLSSKPTKPHLRSCPMLSFSYEVDREIGESEAVLEPGDACHG